MTDKMRLRAVVPNEGARRLAAWMVQQPAGTYQRFVKRVGGAIMADRLLGGEVRPGRALAYTVYAFTAGAVVINAWSRPAKGWWFDPAFKPTKRAA